MTARRRPASLALGLVALASVGISSLLAHAAAASAATTSAGQPAQPNRPAVTVSGGGCPPNSLVAFTSHGQPAGSVNSDPLGNFTTEAELPPGVDPERPQLSVTCGPVVVAVRVELGRSDETDPPALAMAGSGAGLALVAAGLVAVVRRRKQQRPVVPAAKEAAACRS